MEESLGSRVVTSSEYRSEMCGRELLMLAKLLSRPLPLRDFRDAKPVAKDSSRDWSRPPLFSSKQQLPPSREVKKVVSFSFFHLCLKSEIVIIFPRVP